MRNTAPHATSTITIVIPVLNAMPYLTRTAPSIMAAAREFGDVHILYVDNGSVDGSIDFLAALESERVRLLRRTGATISELRNLGAGATRGSYISFVDADCDVGVTYLRDAVATIESTLADAAGCEYSVPEPAHWIEKTLHDLHYVGRDRNVVSINGGNLFVRRAAFERVGGFREDLITGEDSDFCLRLVGAGLRVREATKLRVVHYGNPKTLGQYYRRTVWHGLGMFATVTPRHVDRPTVMLGVHLLATAISVLILIRSHFDWPVRFTFALLLQLAVPTATVVYRILQTRRLPALGSAILLYWLYYWARVHALAVLATGGARRYRK